MMCQLCNKERLGSSSKPSKLISKRRKPTGEKALFEAIWASRPHICQVSGEHLGDEPRVHFFSHILPKGLFSKFRLYEKNIWLCSMEVHHLWETKAPSDLPPMFKEKLEMREELRREYERAL